MRSSLPNTKIRYRRRKRKYSGATALFRGRNATQDLHFQTDTRITRPLSEFQRALSPSLIRSSGSRGGPALWSTWPFSGLPALDDRIVITVAVTNESHTIGSHDRWDHRADSRARSPDLRGAGRIGLVHDPSGPVPGPAFQVVAMGHSRSSCSVKRGRRILGFPSCPAAEPVDCSGKPRTSDGEPFQPCDTRPSVDQQEKTSGA